MEIIILVATVVWIVYLVYWFIMVERAAKAIMEIRDELVGGENDII